MLEAARVLVLNQTYEPINVCGARRAVRMMLLGKAETIEVDGMMVRSERLEFRLPAVIRLLRYIHVPRSKQVPFSKKNVFRRDEHACQYCGAGSNLTIDHIVPLSRGGRSGWDNVVCCCRKCNGRKGNRLPEEAGMALRRPARKPRYYPFEWMNPRMTSTSHFQWDKYMDHSSAS
jgi:5-methylcytosine-specific restriction endonuclease McrA